MFIRWTLPLYIAKPEELCTTLNRVNLMESHEITNETTPNGATPLARGYMVFHAPSEHIPYYQ